MTFNNNTKYFLFISSLMMALTVSLGAFGAHGLKSIISPEMMKVYHTGIDYSFYNTLGLFLISILMHLKPNSKKIIISAWLLFIGTIIFSFSLYALVLLNLPILGAITPIGGTLIIIAWITLAFGILKD